MKKLLIVLILGVTTTAFAQTTYKKIGEKLEVTSKTTDIKTFSLNELQIKKSILTKSRADEIASHAVIVAEHNSNIARIDALLSEIDDHIVNAGLLGVTK